MPKNASAKRAQRAAQPKPKPRKTVKPTRPQKQTAPQPRDRNEYLESLLSPDTVSGAKVPDDSTIESATLQTRHTYNVETDAQGRAMFVFAPSFCSNGAKALNRASALRIGMDASGNLGLMDDSSPNKPAGFIGTTKLDIMSTKVIDEMASNFASVRPVSACLSATCTEAALNAQGVQCAGLWARGQLPSLIVPAAIGGDDFLTQQFGYGNGPHTLEEVKSGLVQLTNATETTCTTWKPQDSNDFDYTSTLKGYTNGAFWLQSSENANAPGTPNSVWLPFTVTYPVFDQAGNPVHQLGAPFDVNLEESKPYIVWCVDGGTASANTHTLTLTINWEVIPMATESRIISATPSPSNPPELAQAVNTMQLLPPMQQPNVPHDVPSKLYSAAAKSADHLYRKDKSQKRATEGRSWIDDIIGFVGDNWSTIAAAGSALLGLL